MFIESSTTERERGKRERIMMCKRQERQEKQGSET